MKRRFIFIILSIGILSYLSWYFIIKPYDFTIEFTSSHSTGIVYKVLEDSYHWKSLQVSEIKNHTSIPYKKISEEIKSKNLHFKIDWEIFPIDGISSTVKVSLKDLDKPWIQRLVVPFRKTEMINLTLNYIGKINEVLDELNSQYKVSTVKETVVPEKFCLYTTLQTKAITKAEEMMKVNGTLMNYIYQNNLTLDGFPFVEGKKWNNATGDFTFNFCYPIKEVDHKPKDIGILAKTVSSKKGIKTIFNGNYRISDRAWYTLLDHVSITGVKIDTVPIEIYYNDPHSGVKEIEWKTEVIMPLELENNYTK